MHTYTAIACVHIEMCPVHPGLFLRETWFTDGLYTGNA